MYTVDPYVKVQLALDKKKWKRKKTSVKKSTQNPYFNESFTFVVSFEQIQVSMIVSQNMAKMRHFWLSRQFQAQLPACYGAPEKKPSLSQSIVIFCLK